MLLGSESTSAPGRNSPLVPRNMACEQTYADIYWGGRKNPEDLGGWILLQFYAVTGLWKVLGCFLSWFFFFWSFLIGHNCFLLFSIGGNCLLSFLIDHNCSLFWLEVIVYFHSWLDTIVSFSFWLVEIVHFHNWLVEIVHFHSSLVTPWSYRDIPLTVAYIPTWSCFSSLSEMTAH